MAKLAKFNASKPQQSSPAPPSRAASSSSSSSSSSVRPARVTKHVPSPQSPRSQRSSRFSHSHSGSAPPPPPQAGPSDSGLGNGPAGGGGGGGGVNLLDLQKRISEAKARLAGNNGPLSAVGSPGKSPKRPSPSQEGGIDLRAMLDHIPKRDMPANRAKAAPKKEVKVLKIEDPTADFKDPSKNPYYDPSLGVKATPTDRRARGFKFVQPGKYVQKAEQERAKARLEKLKEEITQNAKKAGVETEMGVSEKSLKKDPPPAVEWWDAPLLVNKTYDDLDQSPVNPDELSQLVTLYVHHPIPIKPPQEQNKPPVLRSLMLTKKEQKKLRRQRRQEAQKEKQDKIRLGLLPPDPPKVKISNLMRVLGEEAIQDPTKVEARVRKEMALRQRQHEMANEQRKLTPEERRKKIANKLKEDQKQSNEVAVFKVKNCAHPKHKYKIMKNAEQYDLTGMVVIHPKCHLVIVEGGPKSIKAYRKLMLRRIDWNDLPTPKKGNYEVDPNIDNKCFLVWEGQVSSKAFRKFTWRSFESEKMAREELSKWHVEQYWDAAIMASDEELAARQPEL
ncbi:pre-mRNA processing factor 3-domain-containing protein [Syncephalastrum racemosum]|uniref:Pre-mRNA processing factor 3-domain-containing protein n=1 Tax=Syncephalastrum racemosum TaxID=13706 RepID=A0A1X2H2J1_SYNRA|nr:pre-mRNA processing factor 3-domain-containing protein [Syncephalastrum racemosum]